MRYYEIITDEAADTFAARHAEFRRQQQKRLKLRTKLRDTESRAADQNRTAAAKRAKMGDKTRDLKRQLAQPKL